MTPGFSNLEMGFLLQAKFINKLSVTLPLTNVLAGYGKANAFQSIGFFPG
jgi:hypothetical protein